MKKLGAIFILLVLCVLCGCSNETGTKNNTTISSESSDTGALTSAKTTYIVGDSEVAENYKNDPTVVVVPESEAYASTSITVESNQNNDSSMLQTHHRPKIFDQYGEDVNVEAFVEWCKECRTDDLMKIKYVDNADFISFLKTTDTLLLPKMKKEGYDLAKVSVAVGRLWYSYWIFYSSGEDVLNTAFKPISKELREHSPKRILEDYISSFPEDYEIVENGMSRFGEYISLDTEKDPDSWAQTVFIVDDYIITASCNGEWKNEYFDYFDFEKVTLK